MHHQKGLIGRGEAQGHRDLGGILAAAVLKRVTTTRGGGLHHTLPSLFSHRQTLPPQKPYQTPTKLLTTTTSFMQK